MPYRSPPLTHEASESEGESLIRRELHEGETLQWLGSPGERETKEVAWDCMVAAIFTLPILFFFHWQPPMNPNINNDTFFVELYSLSLCLG